MDSSQSATPIFDIMKKLTEKIVNKPDYLEIFLEWEKIVGKELASICAPLKSTNIGKDKALVLKTVKGRGLEVQHEAYKILDLVNSFLKKETFSQIKVVQTESTEF
jgi:hypothetical protein